MRVLVVVSSKYGSTAEVGTAITEELADLGFEARRVTPGDVDNLDGVGAVVLGSAVYMSQWMETARNFVRHYETELRGLPLWVFSVGLSGVPIGNVQDPRRLGEILGKLGPIDHQTFKGRMNLGALTLRERSVARLGNAPEGDFREWEKIRAWARGIGHDLREHLAPGEG
ncbi:MAG TPA: flavodoxin domain-containing protein [Actinomycetaceae bacterium]|nr:flavodoxin domain-containing protein [Actinomycetaceae bacterium]